MIPLVEQRGSDWTEARLDGSSTAAGRPVSATLSQEFAAPLRELGFRKRAGTIFTREVAGDVLGRLGLNRARRDRPAGEFEVNPVVGIRHQGVERVVAELRNEKFHGYLPPTVSSPLGYLMPESRYRAWIVSTDDPGASVENFVAAVSEYALPFMESGSTLTALCDLMSEGLGFEHQLVYRLPVAWMLPGDLDRAVGLVDAAEAEVRDRGDPAAVELRSFVAAFRSQFPVSSSERLSTRWRAPRAGSRRGR